jgi:hypothetical protein
MERMRWTSIIVCASVLLACNRKIEEPPQNNRHRAEAYCEHSANMHFKCAQEKLPEEEWQEPSEEERRAKRERCEAGKMWDWTDDCAGILAAKLDCYESVTTCEEYDSLRNRGDDFEPEEVSPCAEERAALASCKVYDEDGNEIDHGQGTR